MDAFVAGAWRTASRGEVYVGGTWRRVTRAEAYIGGQWRPVLSFAPPMSLTAPPQVAGYSNSNKPITRPVTAYASVVPNGGVSPYRYQWQNVDGLFSFSAPTNAGTSVTATVAANSEYEGTIRVTCTDAQGSVATADISVYLSNQSNF